jgi:60 kDa SS-A/Ro ribonucleoprotein
VSRKRTPQSLPIPGQAQVQNYAGGYVYQLDKWEALNRFLILGTEGGTYYADEQKLTREAAANVEACIAEDLGRVVRTVVEVSDSGRAPRNTPALFTLALAAALVEPSRRKVALEALPKVARIPTHLFQWVDAHKELLGSNTQYRRALGTWFSQEADHMAYELVKYQAREGWTNRDVLRQAHWKPASKKHEAVMRWVTGGMDALQWHPVVRRQRKDGKLVDLRTDEYGDVQEHLPRIIAGFEEAKGATTPTEAARLIMDYGLTREMVPSQMLQHREVWEALLHRMPLTAMIRNLGKMTSVGLLEPMSDACRLVCARLRDQEYLRRSRVHPMAVLIAERAYKSGAGRARKIIWPRLGKAGEIDQLTWTPVGAVVDALDDAFYLAFGNVRPMGKRLLLALDVSGSMGAQMTGYPITVREASAAMVLVTMRVEDPNNYIVVGFTSATGTSHMGDGSALDILDISPKQRLDEVVKAISDLPFGGTDCSLPFTMARQQNLQVDAFVTLTDSESWAGKIHPSQALQLYRDQSGIAAKAVVQGMTATDFTVLDPADPLALNVVGFDTATPNLIADFVRGEATQTAVPA